MDTEKIYPDQYLNKSSVLGSRRKQKYYSVSLGTLITDVILKSLFVYY